MKGQDKKIKKSKKEKKMAVNEKYSNKAFAYHGVSFKLESAKDFNNSEIQRSCFYQEWVEGDTEVMKDIFPTGMIGVTFRNCNLDNVYVDEVNNELIDCSHRAIKVQNDWDDWILDGTLKPVEPMNKEQRIAAGVSIDPKDIPETKMTEEERKAFEEQIHPEIGD